MQNYGTKVFKILLCLGVFGYLVYHDISKGTFSVTTVTAGLALAGVLYLITSLFGIVLLLSGNYLIAIIGTAALALFLAFKLDEVVLNISWLTEDGAFAVLGVLGGVCMVRDFFLIKRSLTPPKTVTEGIPPTAPSEEDENEQMRRAMKANPQSVLNLSNMLEERWGRKPSYEEVMDYIDSLVIPED